MGKLALDETLKSVADAIKKMDVVEEQKQEIESVGLSQINSITNKGKEVLDSIPDDYSSAIADINTLKEDVSVLHDKKITKFYASNQGGTHVTDSDNGKIQDMMLYGKSEQNQYKGINLLPTDISYLEIIEVSISKGARIFWATDGTPALGGNFRFYNEDKTQEMWFGVDTGKTAMTSTMSIDAKYIQFLISKDQLVKICLGIGDDPVYEPYTGGQPSPSPDYPQEIKSVVNPTVKVSSEDETESQTVTLPYTLNAIPVLSGGNVTINGQQYVADYVDVERGKLVKKLKSFTISDIKVVSTWGINENADNITGFYFYTSENGLPKTANDVMTSTILRYADGAWGGKEVGCAMSSNSSENYVILSVPTNMLEDISSDENACTSLVKICEKTNAIFFYSMTSPIETDLTLEEIEAFKKLVTYYPVTSISVNSEQLDGYTVFNYPISMANGWNYVKKQLNDNRDYIYDMDIQSAEAYVNSEYAVALTELEV